MLVMTALALSMQFSKPCTARVNDSLDGEALWHLANKEHVVIGAGARGVDVQHHERLVLRDERMRRAGRQAQKVAGVQLVGAVIEKGDAAAGEHVIELLRDLVVTDA